LFGWAAEIKKNSCRSQSVRGQMGAAKRGF